MATRFSDLKFNVRSNRNWRIIHVGVLFLVALSLSEPSSWAQFGGGGRSGYDSYGGMGYGAVMENPDDPAVKAKMEAWQGMTNAMTEYRHAQGDDAKAAAQKKLAEALTNFFDADMKVREAGLQKVEAQVKTLRSRLDKRTSKKQEIIDLQMKLLENETAGLGFFGSPAGAAPMMGSPYGMPMNGGLGPGQPGMMGNVLFEGGPVGPPMLMNPSSMEPEGGLPTMPGAINRAAPPQPGGPETTIRTDAKPVPRRNSPSESTEPAPKR